MTGFMVVNEAESGWTSYLLRVSLSVTQSHGNSIHFMNSGWLGIVI